MKKKNIGKKTLTAMGAVVAAGLTPSVISGVPLSQPQPSGGITAADVVAIDGITYGFDELYAKQQPDSVDMNVDLPEIQVQAYPHATKYGIMTPPEKSTSKLPGVRDLIYRSVEQMPQFPGGEAALMKYLQSHINYPPMAAQNNIQGIVIVQMVIEQTGQVGEVKVVRSVDNDLDKEAIRVCKSLPKCTPGRQNGQAAAVWYTLPVSFKL